ncbi:hypothetical protein C5167_025061 [Papaver somniferum]|uniref:Uncharacterized protein n=1 Tax=Papaver somniferum TaxID=3469 RepID=A0A4Y7JQC5_PAPSO|nr:hypothetical protein C5167_025061 [Papaver somniferum]
MASSSQSQLATIIKKMQGASYVGSFLCLLEELSTQLRRNLKLEYLDDDLVDKMCKEIGKKMEEDPEYARPKVVKLLKDNVEVDITKPLRRGTWVLKAALEEKWVIYHYEKQPRKVMTENVEDDPRMLKRSRKYESDSYSVLSNETSIVPSQIPISYENRLYQTQPRNQVIPQINMSGNICHTKETSDSHLDHGLSMDSTAGKEKNGGTSVCYTVSGVDQTAASQGYPGGVCKPAVAQDAEKAEALAAVGSIKWAKEKNISNFNLEGDSLNVINGKVGAVSWTTNIIIIDCQFLLKSFNHRLFDAGSSELDLITRTKERWQCELHIARASSHEYARSIEIAVSSKLFCLLFFVS